MRKPGINLVERALIAQAWQKKAVDANIHTLIGDDSDRMVNLAGRMLYVGLGGAIASGIGQDDPDVRIIRGACNALCDQAGEQRIDPMRRASLVSGLQAVARLMPKVSTRALTDSACELELRLRRGDVMFSDFEEQML